MIRLLLAWWMLCCVAPLALAQSLEEAGAGPVQVEAGKVLVRAEPFADGLGRGEDWSTVRVVLANGGPATEAVLRMVGRSPGEGGALRFERRVELPRGARRVVHLDHQPGRGGHARTLGVTVGREALEVDLPVQLLGEADVTVGVIGLDLHGLTAVQETWREGVPGRQARAPVDTPRKVRAGLAPVETLPTSAFGWQALDWAVWPQADPGRADARQLEALGHWVADGGHLLITVTDRWRAVADSPLGPLLPVTLTGVVEVDLSPFARGLGAEAAATVAPVATGEVRALPGRHVATLASLPDGAPLWVAGTYGLGTVHVLLADPGVAPLSGAVAPEDLWRRLLFLPSAEEDPDLSSGDRSLLRALDVVGHPYAVGDSPFVETSWRQAGSDAEEWERTVREYLQDIPGASPLPLPWLLGFSVLYLLCIGPLDYFLLRALGRQPLTWITFPATVVVFSTAALVGTALYKGNQAVMTRLELVDVLPGTAGGEEAVWRGDTYLGVFATRKAALELVPGVSDGIARALDERGTMFEPVVSSAEGPGGLSWRAETWTLAYARTSWIDRRPGGVRVERSENGWRIHNDLGVDLARARLQVADRILPLGPLPAGAHREVEGPLTGLLPGGEPLERRERFGPEWALGIAGARPDAGRGRLDSAAHLLFLGVTEAPLEPFDLAGLDPAARGFTVYRVPISTQGDPL